MPPAKRHLNAPSASGKPDVNPVNRTGQARKKPRDDAFAARLHLALDGRGQAWLAQETGLSTSTINDYAQGAIPSADRAFVIADALAVSAEWLITGKDASRRQLEPGVLDGLPARLSHNDLMRGMDAPLRTRIRSQTGPVYEYLFLDQYGKDYRFIFVTPMPTPGFTEITEEGAWVIGARAAQLTPNAYYLVRVDDEITIKQLSADGAQLVGPAGDSMPAPNLHDQGRPPFVVAQVIGTPIRLL